MGSESKNFNISNLEKENQVSHIEQNVEKKGIKGMYEGAIMGLIFKLAAPVFIGMFFQLLYGIVDTIWVSRIDLNDPSYVGGIGIIFPLIFTTIAISSGILIGVGSLVARSIGRKDYKSLNRAAESGLLISSVLSLIFLVLGYTFDEQLIKVLGAKGDYFTHALEYFRFIIPAACFAFMAGVFHGILQGEGLTKNIMIGMLIATTLNMILDPIFIFTFNLKIKGAAIATVISSLISGFYFIHLFIKKKTLTMIEWKFRNISFRAVKEILSIGFPQTAGQIALGLSFLVYNRILSSVDSASITSFSICGRFDQILLLPINSIAFSLITIIGQNFGRKNHVRMIIAWRAGLLSATSLCALFATILVIYAPRIYPFFSSVEKVISYSVRQTRIVEYTYILGAVSILSTSSFQAIAKPLPGMIITLLRLAVISIPLAVINVFLLKTGVEGVWLGLSAGNTISGIIAFFWVKGALKKFLTSETKQENDHFLEADKEIVAT